MGSRVPGFVAVTVPILVAACALETLGTGGEAATVPPDPDPSETLSTPDDATSDAVLPTPGEAGADVSVDSESDVLTDTTADTTTDAAADAKSDAADAAPDAMDAGPPPCPTTSTLLVCMRFEGNVTDQRGALATPTINSNLTFGTGAKGQAVRFTLSPLSMLRYANQAGLSAARTIEMWVNPASIPGSGRHVLIDLNGEASVSIHPGGIVHCALDDVASSVAISANVWSHVACTRDGTNIRVYVNGQLRGTAASPIRTNTGFIGIGHNQPTGDDNYNGWIDELRIWSVVRTAQEIAQAAQP